MAGAPVWAEDARDWPNRAASRFVEAGGLRWHVQVAGEGPTVLLLHGTGASTHSWAGLLPLLAARARVVAPDLPGQGFTQALPPARQSLPGMAQGIAALLAALGAAPALVVGHSAGAAIGARLCLDAAVAPLALVSLNGAMLPLGGLTGTVFSSAARALVGLPFVPWLFARRAADGRTVRRLLADTGSALTEAQVGFYARLFRRQGHVAATLAMMANWDLRPMETELKRLTTPLLLVVGGNDRTVPPTQARRVRALVPEARIETLPGLGHLAHEERPEVIAQMLAPLLPAGPGPAPAGGHTAIP
jgi:magnesium chelatase accessory protein